MGIDQKHASFLKKNGAIKTDSLPLSHNKRLTGFFR
jgi:hypothetical protein